MPKKRKTRSERVTVRLSLDQTESLEKINEVTGQTSLSETIRSAVDEYISKHLSPGPTKEVSVELPSKVALEMDKLIVDGTVMNIQEGIRTAVRQFVKDESAYFYSQVKKYDEARLNTSAVDDEYSR